MSDQPQHTPEPWNCQLLRDRNGMSFYKIIDVQGATIADIPIHPLDPPEWSEANARLMTTAPRLVASIEDLVWQFLDKIPDPTDSEAETISAAQDLVRTARGQGCPGCRCRRPFRGY